jgi:ABC-type Fe3+/spermidine/putrescine transport system ATPase subunit
LSTAAVTSSSELEIAAVSKRYGSVVALESCSLSMKRGEILALLGPSGCGKSTLLNIIAGFEISDTGSIQLRGRSLNDVPPHRRDVAMVFQNYALFPHMTVTENIAYGLYPRRLDAATIRSRTDEMLTLLKLRALERRYPGQLSGGQRQRVAMARALAIQPQMLLLDEAFSALDRNLREEMQLELSLLLHRLQVSTILVTHDQREAFALADRIAIMETGRISQIGAPREIYEQPASDHVLQFLGTTNALDGVVEGTASAMSLRVADGLAFSCSPQPTPLHVGQRAVAYIRTEDVDLTPQPTAIHTSGPGVVALVTFLGAQERIVMSLGAQQVVIERPTRSTRQQIAIGAALFLDFDPAKCRIATRAVLP